MRLTTGKIKPRYTFKRGWYEQGIRDGKLDLRLSGPVHPDCRFSWGIGVARGDYLRRNQPLSQSGYKDLGPDAVTVPAAPEVIS